MKKITCGFVLSTMLLGTLSPTIRVISETSSVITKETSTIESSESTNNLLPQSSPLSTTYNSTISDSTTNENQVLHQSKEDTQKELLTTTAQAQRDTSTLSEESITSDDIASGSFGTSAWRIDSNGTLYIGAGEFSDTPLNPNGSTSSSPWFQWRSQIKSIHLDGPIIASDSLNNLFDYLSNVTDIEGIEQLDTSKTTKMQRVFGGCSSLTSLDLTSWDVSKVVDIFSLFNGATNMQSLNVSNWDTSSMTNITYAFSTMSKLKNLDLSRWRVTPLNATQGVFMGDSSLEELDLTGFDMTKLPSSSYNKYVMTLFFQNTNSLKSLKLSDKFRIWGTDDTNVELPEILPNNEYSGKWENIGSGTNENPNGKDVWTSKELTQNFNLNPKNDTYVWQPISNKAADLTVKYLDTNGNKISADVVKSGDIGDPYTTEQKSIAGYVFKNVQGNVTGTLTDQTQTVTYIYKVDQSTLNIKDSTIYTGDKWKPQDNFVSATDVDGNDLDFSQVTVDASNIDTNKEGTYEVIYSYGGLTQKAKITVKLNQTNVESANINPITSQDVVITGTLPAYGETNTGQKIELSYSSAAMFSLNNKVYNQNTVSGNQMFNYSITRLNKDYYTFTFTLPNGEVFASGDKLDWFIIPATLPTGSPQLSQKLSTEITVGELKAVVNVHNSSIYVGDTWKAEDNFDSALDKDGNKVDFSQMTVDDSKVDITTTGVYDVTYTFDGVTSNAKVSVKDRQTAVNVHDSTLYVGDTWKAEENFDSAFDKDGHKVDFSQLTVDDSKLDLNTPGIYDVTYTYDGMASTAKVSVKNRQTAINVHDSSIYVGDNWKAEENFDSAFDKDGHKVDFSQLTVDDSKVHTSKASVYDVSYTYDGVTSIAKVTVKDKESTILPSEDDKNKEKASEKNDEKITIEKIQSENPASENQLPETGESQLSLIATMVTGLAILLISVLMAKKQVKK